MSLPQDSRQSGATLFLSDLDGTLLDPSARLSDYAVRTLSDLIRRGLRFTVATARTAVSVSQVLAGLELPVPLILMNGAQIYDMKTRHYLHTEFIRLSAVTTVIGILSRFGVTGFMYGLQDDSLSTYYERLETEPLRAFARERQERYGKVFSPVDSFGDRSDHGILYFVLLDRQDRLMPIRDALDGIEGLTTAFYPDIYSGGSWYLEVFSDQVSKGNAARYLRQQLGYDRMVGFGDNLNDLPLFSACDESYAVGNAHPDLLSVATGKIGNNSDDGVVRWLVDHFS